MLSSIVLFLVHRGSKLSPPARGLFLSIYTARLPGDRLAGSRDRRAVTDHGGHGATARSGRLARKRGAPSRGRTIALRQPAATLVPRRWLRPRMPLLGLLKRYNVTSGLQTKPPQASAAGPHIGAAIARSRSAGALFGRLSTRHVRPREVRVVACEEAQSGRLLPITRRRLSSSRP